MMPTAIWCKICQEIDDARENVILNIGCDGEPFLHPDLLAMLQYARNYAIYPINITTNGTMLQSLSAHRIIAEGLVDVLNISLDALDADTYRRIRGGDLNRVLRGVLRMLTTREAFGSDVKIQVNIIDQSEVDDELEAFIEYWKAKVDNVLVRIYYDATSVTGATGPNITGKQKDFPPVERWPCQQFWRRFNIADDGTAHFCVDDWHKVTAMGNIKESPIAEIWQSAEYNKLRQLHMNRRFDEIAYCANCTEWQGSAWDYDYFVALRKLLGEKFV
jgi:radical SAM protein with 4Fe4S-binding SPASM domain